MPCRWRVRPVVRSGCFDGRLAALSGQIAGTEEIAVRERCSERSIRMTLSLAFLSPEVVQAIIAGRLPRGIGMTGLADLPPSWNAQHAALGVSRLRRPRPS